MKPSCPQLAGTERIRPHPSREHRRRYTRFTIRESQRLAERKQQYDWSRARVSS